MLIVSPKEKIASDIWSVRLTDSREETTQPFKRSVQRAACPRGSRVFGIGD